MFFRATAELGGRRPELLVGQLLAHMDLKPVPGERPLVAEGLATVLTDRISPPLRQRDRARP